MISAVIITKNEEQMLPDCLKSLDFVDEIVIVDSNSKDKTVSIAKKFKAKVFRIGSVSGFDQKRNIGLTKATGDWILYVDADERVSPELKKEIFQITSKNDTSVGAYAIRHKNIYLGKEMHFGGWGNDYVIRLFPKSSLSGWQNQLHEQPVFTGQLQKLTSELIHYSHRDLASMVEKTVSYTDYEAGLRFSANHPRVTWWRFLRVMFTEFWLRFIKLSAYRDGPRGIIDGMFQVYNSFIIYARLWELQNHDQKSTGL